MDSRKIKVSPQWEKSKEEIWQEHFSALENGYETEVNKINYSFYFRGFIRYSVAALLFLVLALPVVSTLFRKNIHAPEGSQVSAILPDSSKVILNAGSDISYNQYLWFINRKLRMDGEVFFEVKSGRSFKVRSNHGTVKVMGTKFNVFDRFEGYSVSCLSGKVSVISQGKSVLLYEGMHASVQHDSLSTRKIGDLYEAPGWVNGKFTFNSEPLINVIAEIERQYAIKISYRQNVDYLYTGYFSKKRAPEEVLEIIGKPFGIEFSIED